MRKIGGGDMDTIKAIRERHSVRQYLDKTIEIEKRNVLEELISDINEKANLHIQIFYDEPRCFDSMMAHYGSFSGVKNYIALVGKKSALLEEEVGYYGEEIVLKAQELGLNTCWVALTYGKSMAKIEHGEKQVCLIALGYGKTQGNAHTGKTIQDVSNYKTGMPEWFKEGVEAALLAPTALNQQKFYFELQEDESVKVKAGKGFYTKLDLGIVKYHFEVASDWKKES